MCAAAAGAFISTFTAAVTSAEGAGWLQAVSSYAALLGIAFGAGAVMWLVLIPSSADLARGTSSDADVSSSLGVTIALGALAVIAVLQVPAVLSWSRANVILLGEMTGGSDPMGLHLIPGVLLLVSPVVVSATLVTFAVSSVLAMSVRADLVPRTVTACVALQGGLVAGRSVLDRALRALSTAIQHLVDSAADLAASARLADWLARYDHGAGSLRDRVGWVFAGYVLVLVAVWVFATRRPTSYGIPHERAVTRAVAAPQVAPAVSGVAPPGAAVRVAVGVSAAPFEERAYSVRPQTTWLAAFRRSFPEYDITSVPPMARARFTLSWTTGVLRRAPSGPDLLRIGRSRSGGPFAPASYTVADAATGAPIGSVVPADGEWEIRGPFDEPLARVRAIDEGVGRARYVATDRGEEVCRFVWGFAGLTAASAEMHVELLRAAEHRIHTALAIVLGVVLDVQARRASYWQST
jgi:hypothetical protein